MEPENKAEHAEKVYNEDFSSSITRPAYKAKKGE